MSKWESGFSVPVGDSPLFSLVPEPFVSLYLPLRTVCTSGRSLKKRTFSVARKRPHHTGTNGWKSCGSFSVPLSSPLSGRKTRTTRVPGLLKTDGFPPRTKDRQVCLLRGGLQSRLSRHRLSQNFMVTILCKGLSSRKSSGNHFSFFLRLYNTLPSSLKLKSGSVNITYGWYTSLDICVQMLNDSRRRSDIISQ